MGDRDTSKASSHQDSITHASIPLSLADEDVCVFKCSVSRETECSRVGRQSFIITLGCNSVLIQFATPHGMCLSYMVGPRRWRHGQLIEVLPYRHEDLNSVLSTP